MNEIGIQYATAEQMGRIPEKRCCVHTEHLHGPREGKYCQFGLDEELTEWKDKHYCIFHLPEDAKRNWNDRDKERFNHIVLDRILYGPRTGRGGECQFNDFSRAVFPDGINLSEAKFGNTEVYFDDAMFMGGVSFKGCKFPPRIVTFERAKFGTPNARGLLDFSDSSFGEKVNFSNVEIHASEVNFQNANLGCDQTSFKYARFKSGKVSFDGSYNKKGSSSLDCFGARFEGGFSCKGACFWGDINFTNAFFRGQNVNFEAKVLGTGDLSFVRARFACNHVSFKNVIFPKSSTNFNEATFNNCRKDFSGTKFHESGVSFTKANFGDGDCVFRNMECHGDATFTKATWGEGHINFDGLKIGIPTEYYNRKPDNRVLAFDFTTNGISQSQKWEHISFNGADINAEVSFENREFLNNPSFNECVFHYAPDFAGAVMHPSTNFKTAVFKDARYEVSERYHLLKTLMKQQSNKEEHQRFYALKQKCLSKNPNLPRIEKFLLWSYDWSSNYGSDYIKVLKCLFLAFLISFIFYFIIGYLFNYSALDHASPLEYLGMVFQNSFDLTLKQTFWPAHAFKEITVCASPSCSMTDFYMQEQSSLWRTSIAVLAVLHLVFNLSMVSLFFISLNWRFKRGSVV